MIKIGITGSLASGKTTVTRLLTKKKKQIFSADTAVKNLYKKKFFLKKLKKKFNFTTNDSAKILIKKFIEKKKKNIKKVEQFVHPYVRNEFKNFLKRKENLLVSEIPLLIESNLTNYFDVVIFVGAKKRIRMKRYISKGGDISFFKILDNRQVKPQKKIKFCDYVINNNKSLAALRKNVKIVKEKI